MKLVGIFTVLDVYNYGTKLQAYAMQEIFRQRGYETEIVLYEKKPLYKKIVDKIVQFLFPKLFQDIKHQRYIRRNYNNISIELMDNLKQRLKAFDGFNTLYKGRYIINEYMIRKHSKKYSVAVCGSDQIWHPILNRNKFWTLQLVENGIRRVSYAPSLGVEEIPKEVSSFYKKVLNSIDYISVREESGAKLLQELTLKPVHVVLDPTLLVGKRVWDKMLVEKQDLTNKNYCLCYLLGTNPVNRKITSEISKILGLTIYNFANFKEYNIADEDLEGEHLYDVCPREFIGLISKAKFVVTDSFHCSAFSIMYHVPFLTLLRFSSDDRLSTNSRIYSLLSQLGLESRVFSNDSDLNEIILKDIDFEEVDNILLKKRNESNLFLDQALQN